MKNLKTILLSILLMGIVNVSFGQCPSIINRSKNMYEQKADMELYVNGSIDVRQLKDEGVDWDVELGVKNNAIVLYGFYGNHYTVEYSNYGAGLDYQIINGYLIDAYLGGNLGAIETPTELTTRDVSYFAYALRAKTLYEINNRIGITLVGQYQQRPDMSDTHGIWEINTGIQIKIN